MVLELHIWGPAFGLPSIDAECIAAAAYLRNVLPSDAWVLVADHDASASPTNDFPALKDGLQWIGGLDAIVAHLAANSSAGSLDANLDSAQRADSVAFCALIRSLGLPLLDLSLYTSFTNYYHATRPAYTQILPWYSNYIIPPSRRQAARARTANLGLSSLDVDSVHDGPAEKSQNRHSGTDNTPHNFEHTAQSNTARLARDSLVPFGRQTRGPASLLSAPQYAARFRLDALASELFEPLDALLRSSGDEEFLSTDRSPTFLDCVALGYLSLMLFPPVPQRWLSDTLETRFPRLANYTRSLRILLLGSDGASAPDNVISPTRDAQLLLPWRQPAPTSTARISRIIGSGIAKSIPGIKHFFSGPTIVSTRPASSLSLLTETPLLSGLLALATGVSALIAGTLYFQPHLSSSSHGVHEMLFESRTRRRPQILEFGDAGATLVAGLGLGSGIGSLQHVPSAFFETGPGGREKERLGVGGAEVVELDVDVDVEGGRR